jgi:FkbM family methyltransferase
MRLRLVRNSLSTPSLQPAFLALLKLCHAVLNYGGGQTVEDSGEIGALEFLRDRSTGPFTLFDVGANDGEYLGVAMKVFGARLKAYSFEPQSSSFAILKEKFGDRVTLRQVALSDAPGSAELFFSSAGETTATLHRGSISGTAKSETVMQTTVDRMCKAEGIERIDLLKIDTEGYEMHVLKGAAKMIESGSVAAIQFEFGDTFLHTAYHFIDFWELLSPRYEIYRILRRGLHRISRYSSDLEIYKIANFLCIWTGSPTV